MVGGGYMTCSQPPNPPPGISNSCSQDLVASTAVDYEQPLIFLKIEKWVNHANTRKNFLSRDSTFRTSRLLADSSNSLARARALQSPRKLRTSRSLVAIYHKVKLVRDSGRGQTSGGKRDCNRINLLLHSSNARESQHESKEADIS